MLVLELKQIRSKDDLIVHAPKLQELFDRLAQVIIQVEDFLDKHPDAAYDNPIFKETAEPDQLRIQLNRVLHMEGGWEVIKHAQEAALNRFKYRETHFRNDDAMFLNDAYR